MPAYNYLHIALRGEKQGATRTLYAYPSADDTVDPGWDSHMVEPGAAIKRFLNATDCYVLQSSPLGHYFSLITRHTTAPERGYMMISILVDNGCSLTGKQLNAAFNQLKRTLIEEEKLTDEAVDAALAEAGVPQEPVKLASWTCKEPEEGKPLAEAAYRTFISVSELESIFSFPSQPDYSAYRCILVVSATTSLRPGVKMPRITVPIRKLYSVVCPEGITASSDQVYDGDRLELTYSRPGFTPHTEKVTVGSPAAYTKYEGSTILIRTAAQTGIAFFRRMPIEVVSAKGTPIKGYTITVNGRNVSTMNPYIDFTEKDLTDSDVVAINVASNNFRPLKLEKPSEELLATDKLELTLQPIEQGFVLRLDFGEGRVFEQQISIEKSTPEYTRLHSGYFHGFRAHRQITDDNTEVYNVDVRAGAPRINVGTTTVGDAEPHQAPKFENVSDEASGNRPAIDTTLPTVEAVHGDDSPRPYHPETAVPTVATPPADPAMPDADTEEDDEIILPPWYRRAAIRWAVIAGIIILAVVAAVLLIPRGDELGPDTPDTTAEAAADSTATAATHIPAMSADEQADVEYLNTNPVWDLGKLRSQTGRDLFTAIAEGNITGIAENPYFAVPGRCTNAQAAQLVDMVWRAYRSPNEAGNRKRLRAAVKDNSIDLRKTNEALARVRPAENANESPRPTLR